jgi:radical SAM protein with 4Fe4S-binding SPASM domain
VEVSAGNVKKMDFKNIYYESTVFRNLRNREKLLKGACGECNYKTVCGGCRGRALAYSGDYLAEDPRCFLRERKQ